MKRTSQLAKILLAEDDPHLREMINDVLEMRGYDIVTTSDGEEGLAEFIRSRADLCLIDIMMPKLDGFGLVKEIRKIDPEVPVVFITARVMPDDRIRGFRSGCDDYITKPFSIDELELRIQAILKRCRMKTHEQRLLAKEVFQLGTYRFDFSNMTLSRGTEKKTLTRKESELLRILVINKNQLVRRDLALKMVWGEDNYFSGRSMDVFITKLRKHLRDDPSISISNIHGSGFMLEIR